MYALQTQLQVAQQSLKTTEIERKDVRFPPGCCAVSHLLQPANREEVGGGGGGRSWRAK